jgi:hypothetical protein
MGRLLAVEFPVGSVRYARLSLMEEQVASMSPHDSFTFPEVLPLGLVVRPYGGIKAEPPDVKAEKDLPRRFMFGCLQKGSFRKTENGWVASYRHPTTETSAEIAYNDMLQCETRNGQDFDCATWLHKARELPKEQFQREIEKELTRHDSEPQRTDLLQSLQKPDSGN